MEALNNLYQETLSMDGFNLFMLGSGIIGCLIAFVGCVINLISNYVDPNKNSEDVIEAFLMTIVIPALAALLTGIVICFFVVTSPVWVLILLRKYIIKSD